VTYYLLLALFPALAAFVSLYGFVANPATIADHVAYLGGLLPSGGIEIIRSQLQSLASENRDALSIGFVVAFVVAFWSANNGIKSLFEALNIAYEEREKRSFLRLNLTAFTFTLGAMIIAIGMIVTVGVVPALLALLHLDAFAETIITVMRWPIILVLVATGISVLYRYGPSREPAKWRWISWGGALATIVWIAASASFSFYLQNFANYNVTYGSLGAVIGLMLWTWISVVILLVGAELNAEMEHQTMQDTTTGRSRPMGERGAVVADTLGETVGHESQSIGPESGHRFRGNPMLNKQIDR
jgi:membrane protein